MKQFADTLPAAIAALTLASALAAPQEAATAEAKEVQPAGAADTTAHPSRCRKARDC